MKPALVLAAFITGGLVTWGALHLLSPTEKATSADNSASLQLEVARLKAELAALKKRKAEPEKSEVAVAPEVPPAAVEPNKGPDVNQLIKAARPFIKNMITEGASQRKEMADRMIEDAVKKMTAELGLTTEQQAAFRTHLNGLAEQNEAKMLAMADNPDINVEAVRNSMREMDPQKAMDDYLTKNLAGEQLKKYETNKLAERAKQIEDNANRRLDRMKDLGLDEAQKDKVFQIMVQKDKNFDPSLQIEGVTGPATGDAGAQVSEEEAIAAVLNEDQKPKYAEQVKRNERDRTRRERWMKMWGMDAEQANNEGWRR